MSSGWEQAALEYQTAATTEVERLRTKVAALEARILELERRPWVVADETEEKAGE